MRLYFSWYLPGLPARTAKVIKPNSFCYYVQKGHTFRENLVSVMSCYGFHISDFHVC